MIAMPWTFLDYVDTSGSNQIEAWLRGLRPNTRTKVRSKLLSIFNNADALGLEVPHFEKLHGIYSKLVAIRFQVLRVAYRPLCFYGPRTGDGTLLAGATERNNHYRPAGILDAALGRRADVLADWKRTVPTCLLEEINWQTS